MPQLEPCGKQMQTITDNKAVVEQNLGAMQKLTAGVAQRCRWKRFCTRASVLCPQV